MAKNPFEKLKIKVALGNRCQEAFPCFGDLLCYISGEDENLEIEILKALKH